MLQNFFNLPLGYGTEINQNEAGDDDIIKGANKNSDSRFVGHLAWATLLELNRQQDGCEATFAYKNANTFLTSCHMTRARAIR